MMTERTLRVEELRLYFRTTTGVVRAVDGVTLDLPRGETMAVIGESGCGKTSLARAILRLLPRNVQAYEGRVLLNGMDLMQLDDESFRRQVRWVRVAMVPQAAMNALNPVVRVGEQVAEPLVIHGRASSLKEALERARDALRWVGVPPDFVDRYPFELSGGMRQRVAIAMALVMEPELVILDEPTSALDVLTQANLMNVLKRIKKERGTSFVLITHDISTSSELADVVAVMYAGQMVEIAPARRFYVQPLHPYAQKLMASVPTLRQEKQLDFIPGRPPSLISPPEGCRFKDRCALRFERCEQDPPLVQTADGRLVRCWLHA